MICPPYTAATHQILSKTPAQLTELAVGLGLPKYAGRQVVDWFYQKYVSSWDEVTNLSKEAHALLVSHYEIGCATPHPQRTSRDRVVKYLSAIGGGFVGTVMTPEGNRATFCVSSQRGCKISCLSCVTGKQGLGANLSANEILNQILSVPEVNGSASTVFMGMGESMDNIDTLLQVITCLTDPQGLAMSPKHITVSTIGLYPDLERFLEEYICHFAINLYNSLPKERLFITPVEWAVPLTDTVVPLRHYSWSCQRRLTFEYTVFSGPNDTSHHFAALRHLLARFDCHVNLIRYHRIPHTDLPSSDMTRIEWLRDWLCEAGIPTTIHTSCNEDISVACGMLSTQEQRSA